MIINCKNCNYKIDTEKDTKCPGCGESGFKVLFSKDSLEPAEDLTMPIDGGYVDKDNNIITMDPL